MKSFAFSKYLLFFSLLIVDSHPVVITSRVLQDFFTTKRVSTVYVKTCSENRDMELLAELMKANKFFVAKYKSASQLRSSYYKSGIYLDLNCKPNQIHLNLASSSRVFNALNKWLFEMETYGSLEKELSSKSIGLDSDVTATWDGRIFYDFYKKFDWGHLQSNISYVWKEGLGLEAKNITRQYSMEGTKMKGAIFITKHIYTPTNLSAQLQDRNFKPSEDIRSRLYYSHSLHIADMYNYTLDLVESENGQALLDDSQFDTFTRLLQSNKVNMSVSPLVLGSDRLKAASALVPLQTLNFPFVFQQPRRNTKWNALILPLQPLTWAILFVFSLFTGLAVFFSEWVKLKIFEIDVNHDISVSYYMLFAIGILAQQGTNVSPCNWAGRAIMLMILLLTFMAATYYNAVTIDALLSYGSLSIKTLHDLTESSIPLIFIAQPYFFPEVMNNSATKYVTDKAHRANFDTQPLEQGLQEVLNGRAFCAEDLTIYTGVHHMFTDEQKCGLFFISDFLEVHLSNFIPKYAPFKELLFRGSLRLQEHGLTERQEMYWYPSKPKCAVNQPFNPVKMEVVAVAYIIVAVGLMASLIILLLEFLFHCYFRKQQ